MKFVEQLGSRGATLRLAALLLIITVSIVASKLWEEHYVESLRKDCSSLFSDRLIPATTLFHLNDALYQKRDILTRYLQGKSGASEETTHFRLGQHDTAIKSHIGAIEKTYLVDDESRLLRELRASYESYTQVEQTLLARHKRNEHVEGSPPLQAAFDEVRAELLDLTKVQQAVGQELKMDSLASATNVTTLLYFQLGIAFALGLLASALAMSMRPRVQESLPPTKGNLH